MIVAYSPLGHGRLAKELHDGRSRRAKILMEVAERYSKTPIQVALNWVIWHEYVITYQSRVGEGTLRKMLEPLDGD
jgi:diketogulonate reductase-like aldo/keto reductase